MHPRERLAYSAIEGREVLKLPDGLRLIVWPVLSLEEWDMARPMARMVISPPQGQPMQPDCKPVHGKVPGPANHLLCSTHGHVVDVSTYKIIAYSVRLSYFIIYFQLVMETQALLLNDEIRARLIGKEPIDYGDAKHIFDDLVSSGLSRTEARQKIAAAAWRIRTSSLGVIERQLQLPLASIGFQLAPACCLPNRQLTRDMTASALFRAIRWYFRWNSGLDGGSYVELFDRFTEMTRSSRTFSEATENLYIARIRPYVTDSLKSFRDPLHLTLVVSDPLIIAAWFGLFLFFWPGQRTTLVVLAVPFAVIYAVAVFTHIFGDNRHAHPLIPIIVVGFVKVADDFFARGYWSRFRAGRIPSYSKTQPANTP